MAGFRDLITPIMGHIGGQPGFSADHGRPASACFGSQAADRERDLPQPTGGKR
jgi:hypothetical protein